MVALVPLFVLPLLAPAPSALGPTQRGEELGVAPGSADRGLSDALLDVLAREDPGADVFTAEAASGPLSGRLRELLLELTAEDGVARRAAELAEFQGSVLWPAELVGVRADPVLAVARAEAPAPLGLTGAPGLAVAARGFLEHLGPGAGWKAKVVRASDEDGDTHLTLRVEAHGHRGARPLGVVAHWRALWRGTGAEARLAELQLVDFEETLGPTGGPLFVDATAAWLGDDPALRAALEPGLDHWRGRLDQALGLPLLGHPAGIALGDVDGDGREDVFLCQPGGLPNRLLLARPDHGVRDVSAAAGVDHLEFSRSALLVDLDGDGDPDLVVGMLSELVFFENVTTAAPGGDAAPRFRERSAVALPQATSLACADVDGDGDLDLFACAYASPYDGGDLPRPYHDARNGERNTLLSNDGDWRFTDATTARGLDADNDRFSFACSFEDYDDDGDPDLYVANDFGRNQLFRNDAGRFASVAAEAGVEDLAAGMGVSWGDANGDGRMDLLVSNMYSSAGNRVAYQRNFLPGADELALAGFRRHARGNSLFLNQGDGTFVDASVEAGITMGRWAWGALFCDLDLDGREDVFSPNGLITQTRADDL